MEKIWRPADKVLSEIGRFVLIRPFVSGVLLLTAVIITLFSNGAFKFSSTTEHSVKGIAHFHSLPSPLIAGNGVSTILSQATKADHLTTSPVAIPTEAANANKIPNNQTLVASAAPTPQPATLMDQPTIVPTVATARPEPTTINQDAYAQPAIPANARWQAFRIHSGENLAKVFKKYKVSNKDAATLATLPVAKPLQHLKPGREMLLIIDDKHQLQKLTYSSGNPDELTLVRTPSGFQLAKKQAVLASAESSLPMATPVTETSAPASTISNDTSLTYISGEVHKSLYSDARRVGLSTKQANQLAQIFNAQKVQRGDQFSVLVGDASAKNKNAGSSNILIAQLTQGDKLLQLIRYTDPNGETNYYTPKGDSLNAGILRAPIQYKRISSYFSTSRFHPVLHFFRPHLGVDYAAPTGTPIKAAGNGVIAEIGSDGGYGNSILIKHDAKYSTLYAHMSRFASDIRAGTTVRQGQVIGYVGSTGLTTGPHLHYEIHVNNVAMNPLTVDLPPAVVPKSYRNQFLAQARILLAQLKSSHAVRLAYKEDNIKS